MENAKDYKNIDGFYRLGVVDTLIASLNYNNDMIESKQKEYDDTIRTCDEEYLTCARLWNEFYSKERYYVNNIDKLREVVEKIDKDAELIGGKMSPQQADKKEKTLKELNDLEMEYVKAKMSSDKDETKKLISEIKAKKEETIAKRVENQEYIEQREKDINDLAAIYKECLETINNKDQEIEKTQNLMEDAINRRASDEVMQRSIEIVELQKEKNAFIGQYTKIIDSIKRCPDFALIEERANVKTKDEEFEEIEVLEPVPAPAPKSDFPVFVDEERVTKKNEWMSLNNAVNTNNVVEPRLQEVPQKHKIKGLFQATREQIEYAINKAKNWYRKRQEINNIDLEEEGRSL